MYNWNFHFLTVYSSAFFAGLQNTVLITISAIALGTSLSVVLVAAQLSKIPAIYLPTRVFTELMIALPVLVLLVWIFYCLPVLGVALPPFWAAATTLGLSLSAFLAELIRGAISAVPEGQLEAARLLGFSPSQVGRYIIFPQVLRVASPSIVNEYVSTLKFSTIASIIAAPELLYQSSLIISRTYRPLETYTVLAAIFLVVVLPLLRVSRLLERRRKWRL